MEVEVKSKLLHRIECWYNFHKSQYIYQEKQFPCYLTKSTFQRQHKYSLFLNNLKLNIAFILSFSKPWQKFYCLQSIVINTNYFMEDYVKVHHHKLNGVGPIDNKPSTDELVELYYYSGIILNTSYHIMRKIFLNTNLKEHK